jgi:hypothetical protein
MGKVKYPSPLKRRIIMTLDEAKGLCQGSIIYDIYGSKWKILSIKTWKRNTNRILISLKYGLYDFAKVDETQLHLLKGK